MKKCLMSAFLIILIFTGCTSKESKNVMKEIDEIGTVTLDSKAYLDQIANDFAELDEKDQTDVANYESYTDALSVYYQLVADDYMLRVDSATKNISSSSLSTIKQLQSEYDTLDNEVKERVTNYNKLQESLDDWIVNDLISRISTATSNITEDNSDIMALIEECSRLSSDLKSKVTNYDALQPALDESNAMKAESVMTEIYSYKNSDLETIQFLINENKEILSEKQLKESLLWYGRWGSLDQAEEKLKSYLKSPRSYYRYSGSISSPTWDEDNNRFKVTIDLEYGANNSFGGEVKDNVSLYSYFTIDEKNCSVTFTGAELTLYYQFKFSAL